MTIRGHRIDRSAGVIVVGAAIHLRSMVVGVLGARHPLAALLPGIDVCGGYGPFAARQQLGYFLGIFSRWVLNSSRFRKHVLLNGLHWLGAGSEWRTEAGDQIYCRARLDRESADGPPGCVWAYVRFKEKRKERQRGVSAGLRHYDWFFAAAVTLCQPRVPAALRRALSPHGLGKERVAIPDWLLKALHHAGRWPLPTRSARIFQTAVIRRRPIPTTCRRMTYNDELLCRKRTPAILKADSKP